ncbi:MAG: type VI secretion system ImpA family N-terminal domain-containing protein [Hyphomicrobiales bacterium]|nr:type VI secretion system ImpA family N-terminal domain-containing protein [Hyphomicrobiales bacterium]
MSTIRFSELATALPRQEDCGPDLDAAGDDDHLGFLARVEGVLPASFAEFDRSAVDFAAEYAAAGALLDRAADLRVLVLLAKLLILDRRLEDFAGVMEAIAMLLARHWERVHPAGDIEFRRGVLMALDDRPHTVMPLQAVPLFESRNLGRVSYRSHLIATGAAQPRETESSYTAGTVAAALERAEDEEIAGAHAALTRIHAALGGIAGAFGTALGAGKELQLPNLRALVEGQLAWLGSELVRRTPAAIPEPAAGVSGQDGAIAEPPPAIDSHAAARAALDRIAGYFRRKEPSSPALLLIRQSRQLADVSFIEALRTLMPDSFPSATIRIGRGSGFAIPMERLGELPDEVESPADEAGEAPDFAEAGDAAEAAMEAPGPVPERTEGPRRLPQVATQREAVELITQVAGFYRAREPSSPLPLLLDRASALVGRDFLAVLEEMLPPAHLRPPEDN